MMQDALFFLVGCWGFVCGLTLIWIVWRIDRDAERDRHRAFEDEEVASLDRIWELSA